MPPYLLFPFTQIRLSQRLGHHSDDPGTRQVRPGVQQALGGRQTIGKDTKELSMFVQVNECLKGNVAFFHLLDGRDRARRPPQLAALVEAGGGRVPALRLRRRPLLWRDADAVGAVRRAARGGGGGGGDGDGLAQPQGGQRLQGLLG